MNYPKPLTDVEVVRAARKLISERAPMLEVDGEMHADAALSERIRVQAYPDSTLNRQLHSYELLVDPAYRIDVAVEDESFYRALSDRLDTGTMHYPVSMGLSEYLAWIEFHGELAVEPHDHESVEVDSAVPAGAGSVVPREGVRTHVERMPAFMEADEHGRRTTGFGEYTFTTDENGIEIRSDEIVPAQVGDRSVVFG